MSINCLSSVQCIINKKKGAAPLTEINLTSAINPMPYNPDAYFSAQSAIVRNSANNQVTACSCTITNQTGNFTFANGVYSFLCSSTTAGSPGGSLVDAFCGTNVYNVWISHTYYNASGVYTGTVSTVTSGTTVTGEWQQIKLPYKLIITTYSVNSNATGGGPAWNQMWTKSFYLCGSNDGTTWTTIDNRSGLTCAANGFNSFTAPTQTVGYMYFRLVGQQIGAYNGQGYKMAICLGLQGIYKIV